jgi:cytochrome c peroxidase
MSIKPLPILYFLSLALALSAYAGPAFSLEPLAPLPLNLNENLAKVKLGERLFHDPKLSNNSQRSCATCHPLDQGAMDGKPRSDAIGGGALLRNTPTLFNVGFNYFFNWDGVVSTLEAHTEKVMLNPKVMGATWSALLATIGDDLNYRKAFSVAYTNGLNQANMIDAMANFERSLITPNARFDRFLRGEKAALNADEQAGYQLFNSLGCVACHQGINIGGNLFQKFGIFAKPKSDAAVVDAGRFTVTKNERDKGVYRVPSLRNVAVTAPYFHDGRAATLEEAVDTMAKDQLGKPLEIKERDLLIQFLRTLTGEYQGKQVSAGEKSQQ